MLAIIIVAIPKNENSINNLTIPCTGIGALPDRLKSPGTANNDHIKNITNGIPPI